MKLTLLLLAVATAPFLLVGCVLDEPSVVQCAPTTREPTGNPSQDLIGYWRCSADGHGQQLCGLNADGTVDTLVEGAGKYGHGVAMWSISDGKLLIEDDTPAHEHGDVLFAIEHVASDSVSLEILKDNSTAFVWESYWVREDCTLPSVRIKGSPPSE